jgi:hypothetical protein
MNDDAENLLIAIKNSPSSSLLRMAYADCLESIGGEENLAEADRQRKISTMCSSMVRCGKWYIIESKLGHALACSTFRQVEDILLHIIDMKTQGTESPLSIMFTSPESFNN